MGIDLGRRNLSSKIEKPIVSTVNSDVIKIRQKSI